MPMHRRAGARASALRRQNDVVHPLDRLAALGPRVDRRRLAVFPDGWGDRAGLALLGRLPAVDAPAVSVRWVSEGRHPGVRVREGWFRSPVASLLPPACGEVPVELTEPAAGTGRLCVLMPAWNDHGWEGRRPLARRLADRGIATLLFDIPFYGARRVVPDGAQAVRTVADFAVMGFAAVAEGRALLAAFAGEWAVGVSGFSMGGNLAALVSATVPFPVATAPLAASHSPGPVYLDGVLRRAVRWDALGGRRAEPELRRRLGSASVLHCDPLPHHRTAVLVAATGDGFVPPSATQALADHWAGSELRWVEAGHATLWLRHRDDLADAVAAAFARLEERGL
jgi:dienelactone hydrolase